MRLAALLALLPVPALAEASLLRIESGPRVLQAEAEEIASARLASDVTGDPIAWIELVPARHADWLAFTKDSLGEEAAIYVCGRFISKPVIQTPMTGGLIGVMGPTGPELQRLVDQLTGQVPCEATP
jgi:preprotein translocase subunit SecD